MTNLQNEKLKEVYNRNKFEVKKVKISIFLIFPNYYISFLMFISKRSRKYIYEKEVENL